MKWIFPPILQWLSEAKNSGVYLLRWLLLATAILFFTVPFVFIIPQAVDLKNENINLFVISFALVLVVLYCTYFLLGAMTFLSSMSLWVLRLLLTIVEFIARRITEAPSGPLLASSILVGGLAAIIKAIQHP
jgi:hypothetical protein